MAKRSVAAGNGATPQQLHSLNVTQGGIVTEEDYKVIKLESNLNNLNKELGNVNDEIEQIKRLLLQSNNPPEEQELLGQGPFLSRP